MLATWLATGGPRLRAGCLPCQDMFTEGGVRATGAGGGGGGGGVVGEGCVAEENEPL